MTPELIILLVVVAVAAVGGWWWRSSRSAAAIDRPRTEGELPAGRDAPQTPAVAPRAPVATPERERPVPTPVPAGATGLPQERPGAGTGVAEADRHHERAGDRERMRRGLEKTRGGFVAKLARLFRGKPKVDADLRERIEEVLFTADIGTIAAQALMDRISDVLDRQQIGDAEAIWAVLEQAALDVVRVPPPPSTAALPSKPYVLLMIGVNGVGKTTTLGKLAAAHVRDGKRVLMVAGDTFRAGAVDQLEVWARRVGCDFHSAEAKADPSSVIYDGITRGKKEGFDVVLCDTAGRLHTRKELMDELGKVRRAATKAIVADLPADARAGIDGPHDTFLVLDATIGQNALAQAKLFKETTDFTGLVITKLDGTAKGGVVLGVCQELTVPIRYVGVGEGVDDLRPFDAEDFVAALFSDRDRTEESADADA